MDPSRRAILITGLAAMAGSGRAVVAEPRGGRISQNRAMARHGR